MSLKHRLSDPELAQLQQVMLREPLPPADVANPTALVDLLGKGLIRLEHNFYWVHWEAISKS